MSKVRTANARERQFSFKLGGQVQPQKVNLSKALWEVKLPRWRTVKNLPTNAGGSRDTGLIPGSGRPPGGGNGNSLQYSFQGNPMGREA